MATKIPSLLRLATKSSPNVTLKVPSTLFLANTLELGSMDLISESLAKELLLQVVEHPHLMSHGM